MILGNKKVREIWKRLREERAKEEFKRKKEEFKRCLKHGKPRGNTRPPMRLTDDPGPH